MDAKHPTRRAAPTALAVLLLTAAATAQIPAHAVSITPTWPLWNLRLIRHDNMVHSIGWSPGTAPYTVRYGHSRDGGRTWPLREVAVGRTRGVGQLAVDGDHLYVGTDNGSYAPHVAASHDGGVTWQPPVQIHHQNQNATEPVLHAAAGAATAIWVNRNATIEVRTARSTDGGLTWSPALTIDGGAPAATPLQQQGDAGFRVHADGSALHVVWTRSILTWPSTSLHYILHQRSLDGGVTWLPTPNVVATHSGHPTSSAPPQPSAIGSGVVYVTADQTLWRSLDQGTTWQPAPGHGLPGGAVRIYDVAADGSNVMVTAVVGGGVLAQLWVNASADRGATWRAVPYTIPMADGAPITSIVGGDTLWIGVLYVGLPMATVQSDDFANNWRLVPGTGYVVAGDADGALVLAPGAVQGLSAWVLEGHTVTGSGSPGTGGIVPALRGRAVAGLGRTFTLELERARPAALIGLLVSFDAIAAVPFGPATLYLTAPLGPFLLTSSASGAASFAVAIPTNQAFVGLRLASQAFVLDPGAAAGFAATGAVETWIR